jgi:DNA repair protein RadC
MPRHHALLRRNTRSTVVAEAAAQLSFLDPPARPTRSADTARTLFAAGCDGTLRPATDEEILDAARGILAARVRRGRPLTSPRHTREYLRLSLASLEHEVFAILFLDNRHRVIEFAPLFRGTVDGASVHPREVVKEALARNAAAVILAHNHPSGIAEPSQADELITARLRDALALVDVRVLDHFVVTGDAIISFAERGLL